MPEPLARRLDKLLGVETQSNLPIQIREALEKLKTDHDISRKTLQDVIAKGVETLDDLARLALDTGEAGHYAVLNGLIKELTNASKALMEVNKLAEETRNLHFGKNKRKDNDDGEEDKDNIVFTGTMQDLITQESRMIDITPKDSK